MLHPLLSCAIIALYPFGAGFAGKARTAESSSVKWVSPSAMLMWLKAATWQVQYVLLKHCLRRNSWIPGRTGEPPVGCDLYLYLSAKHLLELPESEAMRSIIMSIYENSGLGMNEKSSENTCNVKHQIEVSHAFMHIYI
jgi:hypothetical protein